MWVLRQKPSDCRDFRSEAHRDRIGDLLLAKQAGRAAAMLGNARRHGPFRQIADWRPHSRSEQIQEVPSTYRALTPNRVGPGRCGIGGALRVRARARECGVPLRDAGVPARVIRRGLAEAKPTLARIWCALWSTVALDVPRAEGLSCAVSCVAPHARPRGR